MVLEQSHACQQNQKREAVPKPPNLPPARFCIHSPPASCLVVGVITHPVSYPNKRPPEATKIPIMMAGAEDPATLSGLRQPMAMAMVRGWRPSSRGA